MGAPLRSRLKEDQRRAQLLELGAQLFGTRAYDDVSIDEIAARADISKGLLYHYFGSKRDFYVAVVEQSAGRLLEALRPDPALEPSARARAGLENYLGFVEMRAEAYTALMSGGLGRDPEVGEIVQSTREAIVAQIQRDIGLVEPRPVFTLALKSFIGAVEAAALHWLTHRSVERRALLEFLERTLEHALVTAVRLDPEASLDPGVAADFGSARA